MPLSNKLRLHAATLSLTLIFAPGSGAAQDATTAESASNIFTAADFAIYQPITALDMVRRVPGFQIDFGETRRGLGQGGANILVNGERLSGKTNPNEQLSRIGAARVVRIEIVDGTSLDIPGLSGEVANVITETTGTSGTWEWRPQFRKYREADLLDGNMTASGALGKLSWSVSAKNESFRNGHRGPEQISVPGEGLVEVRREDGQYYGDNPRLGLDLTWKPIEDHTGNLNLEYRHFNFNGFTRSDTTAITPSGTTGATRFKVAEDHTAIDVGGDYELPLGPGKLKLIALHEYADLPTAFTFDIYSAGALSDGSRYSQDSQQAESIVRTEYSWAPKDGRDWQLGLEGAFNSLDFDAGLELRDDAGVFIDDPASDESSRVEEARAEATLTHSRTLSSKWSAQVSLGVEYSELSQSGSAELVREFIRPKGFVDVTYKPSDSLSLRGRMERKVGQLNFFDFISSVNLQDNLDQAGNPDLVPDQTWLTEFEIDKNFGGGNTFGARFYYEDISDIVDRIPVGADGDAVGNIDSAERYGVDFTSTLKGDGIGLKGTELNLELNLRDSSVKDPLTGIDRRLNEDNTVYWNIDFRHDIPDTQWAYGIFADRGEEAPVFRLNTVGKFTFTRAFAGAFIEHKDIYGLKVRATAYNLLDSGERLRREFYDARRDVGQVVRIEDSRRTFDPFIGFSVSGTF